MRATALGLGLAAVLAPAGAARGADAGYFRATGQPAGTNERGFAALPTGEVVACGPPRIWGDGASCELWDPATDLWTKTTPLSRPLAQVRGLTLDDGRILMVSADLGDDTSTRAELWSKTGSRPLRLPSLGWAEHAFVIPLPRARVLLARASAGAATRAELFVARVDGQAAAGADPWAAITNDLPGPVESWARLPDGRVLLSARPADHAVAGVIVTFDPTTLALRAVWPRALPDAGAHDARPGSENTDEIASLLPVPGAAEVVLLGRRGYDPGFARVLDLAARAVRTIAVAAPAGASESHNEHATVSGDDVVLFRDDATYLLDRAAGAFTPAGPAVAALYRFEDFLPLGQGKVMLIDRSHKPAVPARLWLPGARDGRAPCRGVAALAASLDPDEEGEVREMFAAVPVLAGPACLAAVGAGAAGGEEALVTSLGAALVPSAAEDGPRRAGAAALVGCALGIPGLLPQIATRLGSLGTFVRGACRGVFADRAPQLIPGGPDSILASALRGGALDPEALAALEASSQLYLRAEPLLRAALRGGRSQEEFGRLHQAVCARPGARPPGLADACARLTPAAFLDRQQRGETNTTYALFAAGLGLLGLAVFLFVRGPVRFTKVAVAGLVPGGIAAAISMAAGAGHSSFMNLDAVVAAAIGVLVAGGGVLVGVLVTGRRASGKGDR